MMIISESLPGQVVEQHSAPQLCRHVDVLVYHVKLCNAYMMEEAPGMRLNGIVMLGFPAMDKLVSVARTSRAPSSIAVTRLSVSNL